MSGIKISELTETQSIQGGCCLPLVSGTDTKKITYANLKSAIKTDIEPSILEDAVEETLGELGDYVTAQGTDGVWTYRKWHSGKAEIYCTFSGSISTWYAMGSIYYNVLALPTLPSWFTKANVQLTDLSGLVWCSILNNNIRFFSAQNTNWSGSIYIAIQGTWS